MAKKKPDSKRSRGADRHTKPRLVFHLEQAMYDALEKHVESFKPKTTTTAVLVTALEEYLQARGLWPDADGEGGE